MIRGPLRAVTGHVFNLASPQGSRSGAEYSPVAAATVTDRFDPIHNDPRSAASSDRTRLQPR
ncbi:MAG: hypothetical protein JW940_11285, partial [Polyangiaceae bacterium]|nr:hypothetical protein [Polyangiaceae bacterium]